MTAPRESALPGGATIGPMLAFAHRAANAAHTEPVKGPALAGAVS